MAAYASQAADTWLGVDSNWDDFNNWSGGQVPSNNNGTLNQAVFPTYSNTLFLPTITGTESFGTLSFISGGWTVGGSGTLAISQISSIGATTINPNLSLSGAPSLSAGGGTLTLNGNISGSSSVALSGNFVFNGNNSNLTGGFSITGTAQSITAGIATALGNGPISISSSTTTTFNNTSGAVVSAGALGLPSGGGTLSITSSGTAGLSFGGLAFSTSSSSFNSLSIIGTTGVNFAITGTTTLPAYTSTGVASLEIQSSTATLSLGAVTGSSSGSGNALLDLDGTVAGDTVTGPITDGIGHSTAIEKTNTNTWTLTGSNTYSGGTNVASGTLIVSDATVYGPGNVNITNSGLGIGSVQLSSTALLSLRANGQPDSTSQILSYANAGSFILGSGSVTIGVDHQGGTGTNKIIQLGQLFESSSGSGTVNISSADGYGLAFNSLAFSTSSSSFNSLSIIGTTGVNFAITGTTTLPAYTSTGVASLEIQSSTATLSLGAVTGSSSGSGNALLDLDGTVAGDTVTGPITDGIGHSTAIEKTNTNTWTLTGSNTYSGGTNVASGTLIVSDATVYGPGNVNITNSGLGIGSVQLSSTALLSLRANGQPDSTSQILSYANAGSFILGSGSVTIGVDHQGGTGTNKIIQLGQLFESSSGSGTVNISSADGYGLAFNSLAFSTSSSSFNSLSIIGTTGVNFAITGTTTLPAYTSTGVASLEIQSSTATLSLGAVTGPSSGSGNALLDLDGTVAGDTVTGPITDGIGHSTAIEKTNTNTWTLTGSNTYSGGTNVASGTLIVSDATVYGPGNVNITNSGLGIGSVQLSSSALLSLRANGQPDSTSQILSYANAGSFILGSGSVTIGVDHQGGTGTNKIIQLGQLFESSSGSGTVNISSADGYGLAFSSLAFTTSSSSFNSLSIIGTTGVNFAITGTTTLPAYTSTGVASLEIQSSTATLSLGAVTGPSSGSGNALLDLDGTVAGDTVTGPITDGIGHSTAIEKTNTNTWTLTGSNTYSGGTNVASGTLIVSDATVYGPGNVNITNSGLGIGSVQLSSTALLSLRANGQPDSTSQILSYANAGSFILGSGSVTIGVDHQGGTGTNKIIQLGQLFESSSGSGTVNISSADGYGLAFNSLAFSTSSSSFNSLSIIGTTGVNFAITGTTTLPAYTSTGVASLEIQSSTATLSLGAVTGPSSGSGNALLDLDGTVAGDTVTGRITDGIGHVTAVEKTNLGAWTLSGSNTYSAGTTIAAGTLVIGNGNASGSPGIGSITNSGYLAFNLSGNSTFTNLITGTGTLIQNGVGSVVLSGSVTESSATINAGTLILQNATIPTFSNNANLTVTTASTITVGGTGTLSTPSGTTLAATSIRQGVLNIGSSSTVTIADSVSGPGNTASTSVLTDLNNSGTLNLQNNDLIVKDSTQFTAVQSAITNAYHGGAWNQAGITSTSAKANSNAYGLGYATAGAVGTTSFDGQTGLASGTVLVKYTLLGDALLTGTVGLGDYNIVLANLNTGTLWSQGAFHPGSTTGLGDYNSVLANFNGTAAGSVAAPSFKAASATIKAASILASPSLSPAVTSSAASDMKLEVNTITGDVFAVATTAVALTGYDIFDSSNHLKDSGDPNTDLNELLLSQPTTNRGNTTTFRNATNYKLWTTILDNASTLAEGENNGKLKQGTASTYDTVNVPSGGTIDFGNVYAIATNKQDLTFSFSEADPTNAGNPVTGTTYGAEVDYVNTNSMPEPGMLGLLGLGGMMMLRRRRKTPDTRLPLFSGGTREL